jgi:lipopolysaccharide transport system permease protein
MPNQNEWTEVISPKTSLLDLKLAELWKYRDLILIFARRDIIATYKQTILGPLWFFIQPIVTSLLFTVVFGNIAKITTDGPDPFLFFLASNICWSYFASSLNSNSNIFVNNSGIFGKVYFPRLAAPLATTISNFVKLIIQLLVFVAVYIYDYYKFYPAIQPNLHLLWVPYLLILMTFLGLGLGIIISSLTTKYRDFNILVGFGVSLLMYVSAVIYPVSSLPEKYKFYISFNPIASIMETFRFAFLGSGSYDFYHLVYATVFTFVVFFTGLIMFNRIEKTFMDTV